EKEAGNEAREPEGRANPQHNAGQGKPHAMPDDQVAYRRAIRAERHADAHLLSSLFHGISHQSVDPYGRKDKGYRAKDGEKHHIETLARSRSCDDFVHGS